MSTLRAVEQRHNGCHCSPMAAEDAAFGRLLAIPLQGWHAPLVMVMQLLPLADAAGIARVCRAWRRIVAEFLPHVAHQRLFPRSSRLSNDTSQESRSGERATAGISASKPVELDGGDEATPMWEPAARPEVTSAAGRGLGVIESRVSANGVSAVPRVGDSVTNGGAANSEAEAAEVAAATARGITVGAARPARSGRRRRGRRRVVTLDEGDAGSGGAAGALEGASGRDGDGASSRVA